MQRHPLHATTTRRHAAPDGGEARIVRMGKVRSARQAIQREWEYIDRTIDRTVERILAALGTDRQP